MPCKIRAEAGYASPLRQFCGNFEANIGPIAPPSLIRRYGRDYGNMPEISFIVINGISAAIPLTPS